MADSSRANVALAVVAVVVAILILGVVVFGWGRSEQKVRMKVDLPGETSGLPPFDGNPARVS